MNFKDLPPGKPLTERCQEKLKFKAGAAVQEITKSGWQGHTYMARWENKRLEKVHEKLIDCVAALQSIICFQKVQSGINCRPNQVNPCFRCKAIYGLAQEVDK